MHANVDTFEFQQHKMSFHDHFHEDKQAHLSMKLIDYSVFLQLVANFIWYRLVSGLTRNDETKYFLGTASYIYQLRFWTCNNLA